MHSELPNLTITIIEFAAKTQIRETAAVKTVSTQELSRLLP